MVAYHPWSGYAQLELARSLGWWDPALVGAQPTVSVTQTLELLANGRAHAGAVTLDEALIARARGLPLTVVALLDVSSGADVVLARHPVRQPSDLRDLRIGHEHAAVGELMTASVLKAGGLRRDQVRMVHLPAEQHESSWFRGEIDVLVTYEPLASRLLARGAVRIFDSQQLPKSLVIADVLVVHDAHIAGRSAAIQHLLERAFRAQSHLHNHPEDSQYRLAQWLNLPPTQVLGSLKGLRLTGWQDNWQQLLGDPPPLQTAAEGLSQFLVEQGLIERSPSLHRLIDASHLPVEPVE